MIEFISYFTGYKALADALANLLREIQVVTIRRNNEAAAYFEQLGMAMAEVAKGLRAHEIPRISGHEMQVLIHAFPEKTRNALNDDKSSVLKERLEQAAATAKTLDGWLLYNQPQNETDREQMLALIERIAGNCRGLAGVLEKPS